jgi:hypothetical protein
MRKLARESGGNTLAMIAVALFPLLALTGGAIDMGRGYLAETRLQQACDAAVLAARKRLGTSPAAGGVIPADVAEVGNRFFNSNFADGSYATTDRTFTLTLEGDFSMTGEASVVVPTMVMGMFGFQQLDVSATCGSQVGMSNTDVMMVLDVTGSMMETNPEDSEPRITELKQTVRSFYDQLEAAKAAGARVRYGFVPYATNVNAGGLLLDDWVTDTWTYQSRRLVGTGSASGTTSYWATGNPVSGTLAKTVQSTYAATGSGGILVCLPAPASTKSNTMVQNGTTTAPYPGPPAGTLTRTNYHITYNGNDYQVVLDGSTCKVYQSAYTNYKVSYDWITQPALANSSRWQYAPFSYDVSAWRTETTGCMEEPDTYEITDYDDVDFDQAYDLNVDHIPTAGNSETQWRPMYPKYVYGRALQWNGVGAFNTATVTTTAEFLTPSLSGTSHCPSPARKLDEMSSTELDSYLADLRVGGSTYHDIGMLWGARLLSPTGLFADDNADVSGNEPTSRHLVFMTDGQTSSLDISYTAYGFEPLDQRRWSPGSALTLTETVEARFAYACAEAKRKNISIWLIAFGTELNPVMTECAGPGHAFQANNSEELSAIFTQIAGSIANLRITN